MANLNTTQIAHDLLGPSQRVYHQDLTTHANQPHLKTDKLGAGDFIFLDSVPAGQNPAHSFEEKGVLTSVERSATATGSIGHFAAVNGQIIEMPERFVLTGTFIEPKKESLIPNPLPPVGTYAPVLLLFFGTKFTGATIQFRPTGQHLNAPGLGASQNRPEIAVNLANKVIDPQNPSLFTLVLRVERSASDSQGKAMLFVGSDEADSFQFSFGNGLTSATVLDSIRVGIGTANGTNYRASVYVTEFEIWAPNPNH